LGIKTCRKLSEIYVDGTTPFIEGRYKGLANQIAQSEEKMNELWGRDLESFKAELRRYYTLNERAIRLYKQSPDYKLRREAEKQ
jgi:hypothetical protein